MSHRPASSLARGIAVVAGLLALIAAPAIGVAAPRPIAVLPPSGDNIAPAILGAARDILKELEGRYANQQSPGFYLATVCMSLGETDQAFAWLEKDFQSRSSVLPFVTNSPSFEPVRNDARYTDLVRRMGLPSK